MMTPGTNPLLGDTEKGTPMDTPDGPRGSVALPCYFCGALVHDEDAEMEMYRDLFGLVWPVCVGECRDGATTKP